MSDEAAGAAGGTDIAAERRGGSTIAELRLRLFALIRDNTRVDPAALRDEARLSDDLGMDSLDFVTVVNEVEHEFKVRIPDAVLGKLSDVRSIVDALWELLPRG